MSDAALAPPKPVLPAGLARRPAVVLLLLCLIGWLPGFFSLPPMDRDEARFAQASKQMVETGNLVDIRFGKAPRYKKPIGIYWLQAAATRLFGAPPYREIWTYRLPSLLGALFAVFLVYWSVRALAPPEAALIAAALLALTLALGAEARLATTDAMLLATVVAAQGVLLRLYLDAWAYYVAGGALIVSTMVLFELDTMARDRSNAAEQAAEAAQRDYQAALAANRSDAPVSC